MKLQARLLLGILPAVALSVLIMGWLFYAELRKDSENELLQQSALVVTQAQRRTDSFLDTATANAKLFASSSIVENYIRVEDEAERHELMQASVLHLFSTYQTAYPSYVEIQLLLPNGHEDTRQASRGRPNLSKEEVDTRFFQHMSAHPDRTFESFLSDADDSGPVFKIGQPVWLTDSSEDSAPAKKDLYGYLVVTANASRLKSEIVRQRIGSSGYFFFMNAEGKIIAHPDTRRIGTRVEQYDRLISTSRPSTASLDVDALERLPSLMFEGHQSILSTTELFDNLFLVSVLPRQELQAVSQRIAIIIALATLITIIIKLAFFWLLLRHQVVSPVSGLQRMAVAIGDGKLPVNPAYVSARHDEIGSLEQAFHEMNAKLSKNIVKLKDSNARIQQLAYRDSLTGLANRRQFLKLLKTNIQRAHAENTQLAVYFLDLDEFKIVNDLLGHFAGDELLMIVAERLCECLNVKQDDDALNSCLARMGGDEFIMMVFGITDERHALSVGDQILETLSHPIDLYDQSFIVRGSIGISLYPHHARDVVGLVKCADIAMYAVKSDTKHQARLYDQDMHQQVSDRVRIESQLRTALERGELRLAYQPQLDICTRRTIGFEALLRWEHPQLGFISPAQFIPIAEQTGLIDPIGAWVVDEACRQWREWEDAGINPGRIAINVSPAQFKLQAVAEVVLDTLQRHQVPVQALEIEITESCMMEAPASVVDLLTGLRKRGVRVAMDDFGTGHSSLATLATLPIDTLKIDRGFVTDVHADFARSKIMMAVLRLANELGLETLAEGVEVQEELTFLEQAGCDVVQGYLMSRPLNESDATQWLRSHPGAVNIDKAA